MNILVLNQQKKKIGINKIKKLAKEILKNLICHDDVEISIVLTDDNHIKGLNKKYLKKDRPTDVLSFPMFPAKEIASRLTTHDSRLLLGDVVISVETAERQARLQKVSFDEEITKLLIHGTLHLLGFKHEKGGNQAKKMKQEEEELMEKFKRFYCPA